MLTNAIKLVQLLIIFLIFYFYLLFLALKPNQGNIILSFSFNKLRLLDHQNGLKIIKLFFYIVFQLMFDL